MLTAGPHQRQQDKHVEQHGGTASEFASCRAIVRGMSDQGVGVHGYELKWANGANENQEIK